MIINGSNDLNNDEEKNAAVTIENANKVKTMDEDTKKLHVAILNSSWCGLFAAFSLLLDSSTDEAITDAILKNMEKLVYYYGIYNLAQPRDSVIAAMCKSSLPINYNLPALQIKLPSENNTPSLTPSVSSTTLPNTASSVSLDSNSSSGFLLSTNAALLLQHQQAQTASSNPSVYLSGNNTTPDTSEFRQQVWFSSYIDYE